MTTLLVSHPACLLHDPGPEHPESPARLHAVMRALDAPAFATLRRVPAVAATRVQLERAHPDAYVDIICGAALESGTRVQLDPDTVMSAGSARAALLAAGGACAAVDAVMSGEAHNAFVATRPPGHHAKAARAMGFCLFANAAIAALHARARWGLRRVAIADFDVHHGNGTQAILENDTDMLFVSSHQMPCYPGTGGAAETGIGGNVCNVPLAPGSGSDAFRHAWSGTILPALDRFAPELLILSAGFDAHRADPLAQLELDEDDFAWLTRMLLAVADRHAGGRVVSLLEGGYDIDALGASVAAHVSTLLALARGRSRRV